MARNRRVFMKTLAAVGLASATARAAEPGNTPSTSALVSAGLDPFTVYRQMFGSVTNGAECYWWFTGSLPFQVDDVGPVEAFQEETFRAYRMEDAGNGAFKLHWREAGVFRDIATGQVPESWFNPVTGETTRHIKSLGGEPASHTVRKVGNGIAVEMELPGSTVYSVTVEAKIAGDRVILTQAEEKARTPSAGETTLRRRTFLKIYSSLAELKSGVPLVASRGFYGVHDLPSGKIFVNGLMQKAAMNEKVNPIAWDRVKTLNPAFFKGDRISPTW